LEEWETISINRCDPVQRQVSTKRGPMGNREVCRTKGKELSVRSNLINKRKGCEFSGFRRIHALEKPERTGGPGQRGRMRVPSTKDVSARTDWDPRDDIFRGGGDLST